MDRDDPVETGNSESNAAVERRRAALRKIATYGAVSGPLLLGLLHSAKAATSSE